MGGSALAPACGDDSTPVRSNRAVCDLPIEVSPSRLGCPDRIGPPCAAIKGSSVSRVLPDWLIIGAPKSGTTTLAACLAEHPEVCVAPAKEVRYFNLHW